MNLAPDILAVLRHASEPLSNVVIRECIAALDDVPPIDAQHLVSDAINALVNAGQVERMWLAGRCTYVIAPNAPPMESSSADANAEVDPLRLDNGSLPEGIAPLDFDASFQKPPSAFAETIVPPPPANQAAIAMPDIDKLQKKILDAITKAGGVIPSSDLTAALPNVEATARKRAIKDLVDAGLIVRNGFTKLMRYHLPGVDVDAVSAHSETKAAKPAKSAPPAAAKRDAAPPSNGARIDAATPAPVGAVPSSPFSITDLRAAASEILLSHGADPLPRALHRLVIAALGAPESLAA